MGIDSLRIVYFGTEYRVFMPSFSFDPSELAEHERFLILSYLSGRNPVDRHQGYATFESLPNGMFYYVPFRRRSVERLLPVFGSCPELLADAARSIGATAAEYGDHSWRVVTLPRIDVVVVLNLGDEELPPEMNLLFPKHITGFLSLEEVAVLGGNVATRLLKASRKP